MEAFVFVLILGVVLYFVFRARPRRRGTAVRVLGVVAGLVAVAVLVWNEIEQWFDRHRSPGTLGELVRRELDSGHYQVVANVLRQGTPLHTRSWHTSRLHPDVQRRFGDADRVVVYS